MRKSLLKIIILALILRLFLALLGEHGDVVNYYWWSKDLLQNELFGFYERSIANAMPPTYPPVSSYVFWLSGVFHELVWKVSWFLNVNIPIFPSSFIFWLESPKGWYFINKFPAIIADLGIVWLIYKFVRDIKNDKAALLASSLFAFSPPFWYNSSLWGQTDSIYALPLLAAFYVLHKDKKILSVFLYLVSILTKPSGVFVLPVFILWWIKKAKPRDYYWSSIIFISSVFFIYLPFHSNNLLSWIINFYKNSLGGELNYIVANAFNLWGLVFGFDNVAESTAFLGIPAHILGYVIYLPALMYVVIFFSRRKKIKASKLLFLSVLISFYAFLILPRMHERYFYSTLLFLVPLAAIDKKLRKIFILLSTIHLINLYHFWWVPRVEILIMILSDSIVEKILILLNIGVFGWLLNIFRKDYAKNAN